jgi:hypothetical protein
VFNLLSVIPLLFLFPFKNSSFYRFNRRREKERKREREREREFDKIKTNIIVINYYFKKAPFLINHNSAFYGINK